MIQVQTKEGGWFYVKSRHGVFTYSIYSTDALGPENLENLKKLYPLLNFRIV